MNKYIEGLTIGAKHTLVVTLLASKVVNVTAVSGDFVISNGTSGKVAVGVLMDDCYQNQTQAVMLKGIAQVQCSGTVTVGERVECISGFVQTSVTASKYIGIALSTGTDVLVDILLK